MAEGAAVATPPKTDRDNELVTLWSIRAPGLVLENVVRPEWTEAVNDRGRSVKVYSERGRRLIFQGGEAKIERKMIPRIKEVPGYGKDIYLLEELKALYRDPKTTATAKGRCAERARSLKMSASPGETFQSEIEMIEELMKS